MAVLQWLAATIEEKPSAHHAEGSQNAGITDATVFAQLRRGLRATEGLSPDVRHGLPGAQNICRTVLVVVPDEQLASRDVERRLLFAREVALHQHPHIVKRARCYEGRVGYRAFSASATGCVTKAELLRACAPPRNTMEPSDDVSANVQVDVLRRGHVQVLG